MRQAEAILGLAALEIDALLEQPKYAPFRALPRQLLVAYFLEEVQAALVESLERTVQESL